MLKKLMASVGIGGATVETILTETAVQKGHDLTGVVLIKGGAVSQTISGIDLHIQTKYKKESNDTTYYVTTTVQKETIMNEFNIEPAQQKEIPFKIKLTNQLPFTIGQTRLWLYTDLNIDSAVDAQDQDVLTILPSSGETLVLNAIKNLGGHLKESEIEERYISWLGHRQLVQELDYRLTDSFNVEEVEFCFLNETEEDITLSIEVDKVFSLKRERSYSVTLKKSEDLVTQLQEAIQEVVKRS